MFQLPKIVCDPLVVDVSVEVVDVLVDVSVAEPVVVVVAVVSV